MKNSNKIIRITSPCTRTDFLMGNFVSTPGSGQNSSQAASEDAIRCDPAAPRDFDPSGNDGLETNAAQNDAPRGNATAESSPPVTGAQNLDASTNATLSLSSSPSSQQADDDNALNRNHNSLQAVNASVIENDAAHGGQDSTPLVAPVGAGLPPDSTLASQAINNNEAAVLGVMEESRHQPDQPETTKTDSDGVPQPRHNQDQEDNGTNDEPELQPQDSDVGEHTLMDQPQLQPQDSDVGENLLMDQPQLQPQDSDVGEYMLMDQRQLQPQDSDVGEHTLMDQPQLQPQDSDVGQNLLMDHPQLQPQDSDVGEHTLMDQPQLPAANGAEDEIPASEDLEPEITVVQRFIAETGNEAEALFFNGTLADAIHASCGETLRDRKPLALYLHDDTGDEQHQFKKKITENAEIGRLLKEEFVTWGWNITDKSQKQRLLEMLKNRFGNSMRSQVTSIRKQNLPALLLILKERGSYDVAGVCEGPVPSEEILEDLRDVLALFLETKSADLACELENEQRRAILREQDQAYEDSLAEDREKQRKKEEEERLAREHEEEEERTRKRKREEEEEEMRKRRRIQDAIKETLPVEPDGSDGSVITRICLKTPSGDLLHRNFLASEPLQTLFQFCASEGFALAEYRLLCGFPRLDLASNVDDSNQSLQHFQLCPRALILLDKRSTEEEKSTSMDD